jgi:hypothetical protein
LVAFIPQTSFYSIQNDPLSPLCFGALFYCLIRLLKAESPDVKLGILTGVAMTITCFAKLTNLPLLAMSALVIFFKMWQWIKAGKLRAALPMFISLAAFAGLSLFWFGWCKYHFGDYTGSEIKVKFLGWTHKPFNEWSNHPIFTVAGTWAFISKLMITFWQGEFWWHGLELNIPAINSIYVILSFSFVGLAVCGLFSRRTSKTLIQRQALWLCIFNFAAVIAFLGFLSILYDFNFCICPSREFPYFTAGRMILGALIPFILLFLYGIDYLFAGIQGDRIRFFALFGMIIFMVVSEIVTDWVVFFSDYNWYHM